MKKLIFFLLGVLAISFSSYSQTDQYNLKFKNLHKKVEKTIQHTYTYHKKSGGFIKSSVTIDTYNDDGLLTQKYYQYSSTYSGSTTTTETLYHYNSKNLMTRTEDISAKKGTLASHYEFTYDSKGRMTKKENVYPSGTRYVYKYYYDNRNRLVREEYLGSKNQLSSRKSYSYSGNKKTKVDNSYDKNGNISATYTSYYKNDQRIRYVSASKYSNNDITYLYDNKDNIIKTVYKGKPNSGGKYTYAYDNKGNWIKKQYKSSTSSTFNFREIYFSNGNVTGSVDFDKNFINRNGNYANVNVVKIVPTKSSNTKTTTTYVNPEMPLFKKKDYVFNYVNLDKKVSSVSGEATVYVQNNNKMARNSTVKVTYSLGGKTYNGVYKVISYSNLKEKGYHFWSLKSTTNNATVSFSINHSKKFIESRDMYLAGMLSLKFNGKTTTFYLEE